MAQAQNQDLWTKFNGREFAAQRAKYDWNGRELTDITGANDSTVSIKQGSNATADGSFTTNQASASTITLATATTTTDGVMSSADKTKLNAIVAANVEDSQTWGHITVTDTDGTTHDINVYEHPTAGPGGSDSPHGTTTTAGETADKTLTFGGTFKVLQETVDIDGHTTTITERTMTMPAAPAAPNDAALSVSLAGGTATQWFTANAASASTVDIPAATTSAPGVMTATDKTNLDFAISVIPSSGDPKPASTTNKLATIADVASVGAYEVATQTDPTDHHPIVTNPDTKKIYLVKDGSSSASDKYFEWICTAPTSGAEVWELIGNTSMDLSNYKRTQTAVQDPTASGNSLTFIDSISQDAQGVITPTKKTVTTMVGASSSANGAAGLVPAPQQNDEVNFLRGDGTWAAVSTVDEKVKATVSTSNDAYPLLAHASSSPTSGNTTEAIYGAGITVNPSTSTVTATTFDGNATTATTATDYNTTSGGIKTALDGKAGKPISPTTGNLAEFDANGDLADSGVDPADLLTGVKLEGAQSPLQAQSGVVTIPNAVATGTSGATATNGLMTADQALILAQLQNWEYAQFTSSVAGSDQSQTFPISQSP